MADLVDVNGTLYGTTETGGRSARECVSGSCGTVFAITTSGVENVIYRFAGGTDGATPLAGLIHANGALYGTTYYGGCSACRAMGDGTLFQLTGGPVSASAGEIMHHPLTWSLLSSSPPPSV